MHRAAAVVTRMMLTAIMLNVFVLIIGCDINTVKYEGLSDCRGKNATDFILFTLEGVTRIDCARKCEETFRCLTIFYNSKTRTCTMHTLTMNGLTMDADASSSCFMATDIAESWVTKTLWVSSSFGCCRPDKLIGPPDSKQWAHVIKAHLHLQFGTEMYVERIDIYEMYWAGGVSNISLRSPDGAWYPVWNVEQPKAVNVGYTGQIFSPDITVTYFKTSAVNIQILGNITASSIDAVKIIGKKQKRRT